MCLGGALSLLVENYSNSCRTARCLDTDAILAQVRVEAARRARKTRPPIPEASEHAGDLSGAVRELESGAVVRSTDKPARILLAGSTRGG